VPRRALVASLIACAALAACGGGNDQEDAEQVVRDFVEATATQNPKLCEELVTDDFLQATTGTKGREAQKLCRQQLAATKGVKLKLIDVKETNVKGDTATVSFRLELEGRRRDQTLELKKEDGDFRVERTAG
jgi:ABC-type glycerol-3-phosphate transport system substrate-binding protein